MTAWKLPVVVAALALPTALGFAVGGPGIGVAVGAIAALTLIVVAALARPRGPIGATAADGRHVLLVAACPVEDPAAIEEIARAARLRDGAGDGAEVVVLAPARIGFLDRWASDVEGARRAAQANLEGTVAALAKAGIDAEARLGDEDVVQAVEDALGSYPATDVVLAGPADDEEVADAAAELRSRLRARFSRVELGV